MNHLQKILILLSVLFALKSGLLFADDQQNPWQAFIITPNKANYEKCSKMVIDSITGPYEENKYGEKINTPTQKLLISNYELYGKFLELVREINPYAVNLAFQLYPLTDGAASEDLFGQIGMMVKEKPEFFLTMIKKYKIQHPKIIDNLATSRPVDEFVDNLDKSINEYEKRIETLEKIQNPELLSLRDQCLTFLFKDLNRYKRIKEEIGDSP